MLRATALAVRYPVAGGLSHQVVVACHLNFQFPSLQSLLHTFAMSNNSSMAQRVQNRVLSVLI